MLRHAAVSSQQWLSAVSLQRAAQLCSGASASNRLLSSSRRYFADSSRPPSAKTPTPASPSSHSTVSSENVLKVAPSTSGQGPRPSPISSPSQPPADSGKTITPRPSLPRKTWRPQRILLYLLITSGLAYVGGIMLALRSDNFHDFFTEYIPFGEEIVLYFEERDFYRRFPNATRHPNRLPPVLREEENKITIPGKSGLTWKIMEEEKPGSDLTKKGPHNSAVVELKKSEDVLSSPIDSEPEGKSQAVLKAKEHRMKKDSEQSVQQTPDTKPESIESTKQGLSQPNDASSSALEFMKAKEEDEPVLQELVRVFNDIITAINASGSASKYSDSVAKARSELEKISERIGSLRTEAQKTAEEEIQKAHATFDESAKELIRRIDETRATEAAQFREEFEAEREKLARGYQEKINTELQRVQELAEQRLQNELVEQAIELNRKFVNDVTELVEREREGRLSKLDELTANVSQLEKLTTEWSDVIEANLKTQQLQVAVDAVRFALQSPDMPKPFVRELVAVKELASDDPVVTAAIASINPAAYQRGIPSTAQIIDRFRRVAKEVRKASLLPGDAGIASHAASYVLNKVTFKRDRLTGGDHVEGVLTRTEDLLEEGNLDAAAREMNMLEGWAKILSKDWLADVRKVLEVRQALEVIETEARLQCLRVQS